MCDVRLQTYKGTTLSPLLKWARSITPSHPIASHLPIPYLSNPF